jgi:hypothetical protein
MAGFTDNDYELSADGKYMILKEDIHEAYKAACHTQLQLWVDGMATHNSVSGECCPDLSCCDPTATWKPRTKLVYITSDETQRAQMLMMTISAVAVKHNIDVTFIDSLNTTTIH